MLLLKSLYRYQVSLDIQLSIWNLLWKYKRGGSKSNTYLSDKYPCDFPLGHSAESRWTVSAYRWRQRSCHGLANVGPQAAFCLPGVWCWNPIHGPVVWPKVRTKNGLHKNFGGYILTIKVHFFFLLILIFCGSRIRLIILRILRLHKFLSNMSYLRQILFLRISALGGMKRDSRNLTLADFQDSLSYWPVPMYSVGHMEVEGYICAFHVSSFTYSTNHIPNSRSLC